MNCCCWFFSYYWDETEGSVKKWKNAYQEKPESENTASLHNQKVDEQGALIFKVINKKRDTTNN